MKFFIIAIALLFIKESFAQNLAAVQKDAYTIKAPAHWLIDSSGLNGTDIIIFSPLKNSSDTFRENVNVMIQHLPANITNLDTYTEISEQQIKVYFEGSKVSESKRIKSGSVEYHKIIYTGKMNNYQLKFEQYYFIKNKKAYLLTYTAEVSQFEEYRSIAEQTLNSFKFSK